MLLISGVIIGLNWFDVLCFGEKGVWEDKRMIVVVFLFDVFCGGYVVVYVESVVYFAMFDVVVMN